MRNFLHTKVHIIIAVKWVSHFQWGLYSKKDVGCGCYPDPSGEHTAPRPQQVLVSCKGAYCRTGMEGRAGQGWTRGMEVLDAGQFFGPIRSDPHKL